MARGGIDALLVDGAGMPWAPALTGANWHDASQLEAVLDFIIIERPDILNVLASVP